MIPEIFSSDPSWPYSKAKTAVIAAASTVIREEGPRAATLKNIATRAGITEPAIFRHFEGVDGLFEGLFSAYERVYKRSAAVFSGEGKGMAKLREACLAIVESLAASHDFSYIVLHARHVFRGYPELKAKVAENDAKDQAAVLACISEGIKAGEVRTDIDPVSAASSLLRRDLHPRLDVDRIGVRFRHPRGRRRSLGRFREDGILQARDQIARVQGRFEGPLRRLLPAPPRLRLQAEAFLCQEGGGLATESGEGLEVRAQEGRGKKRSNESRSA